MRTLYVLILLACVSLLVAQGTTLPTCYYTYDQISQMLTDHQEQHPDIARKVLLGYTQQDNLPIYALRISDNVQLDEEEPALLFVGQVHAEEVLGVQITMANIAEILNNRYTLPYSQWINQLDVWFVPTFNPEGHTVVTSNLDTSYRKNKRDNDGNGIFDFSPLVGYDADGVDFNRNFAFNWCHGDTLYQPGGLEVWDYYRGPGPMSESENQAMKQLGDSYPFVYSICWHSSRTGNLSEKAYYSFNWREVRPSPDVTFASAICAGVAGTIVNEAGTGTYEALPNLSRKGAFHDWMYQQYGTFQILIECGTRNLQPDSLLMVNTIQRCSNAVRWMLNRALPFSSAVPSSSMLTGNIRDALTNEPLQAEIVVPNYHKSWFRPRLSNPTTGRYWKALPSGLYSLLIRKRGYEDKLETNVMVNNGSWTQRHFSLQPKPLVTISGAVRTYNMPLEATIRIWDPDPVTFSFDGNFSYDTYSGDYPVEVWADGYQPWKGTIHVTPDSTQFFWQLTQSTPLLTENWENGTDAWSIEGPWVLQQELASSGNAITDSWGGFGFYSMNCDVWIAPKQKIHIPQGKDVMLVFDSHLYTEWDYDFAFVEVSQDSLTWNTVWVKSGQHEYFNREMVPLEAFAGQDIHLRFHLTDQSTHIELTDPGWTIDNIRVLAGSAYLTSDSVPPPPPATVLHQNYPNPFNPGTTIRYSLSGFNDVTLRIYNIRGQKVRELVRGVLPPGEYQTFWNGRDETGRVMPSGVYFAQLRSGGLVRTRRMVLLK